MMMFEKEEERGKKKKEREREEVMSDGVGWEYDMLLYLFHEKQLNASIRVWQR